MEVSGLLKAKGTDLGDCIGVMRGTQIKYVGYPESKF
jgi:hypothetical protein